MKPGTTVLIAISGGTGVYTSEAVVQRCDMASGQMIVSVNGSFRFQQRRQHERYRCDMQVRLRVVGDTEWISGVCRDISVGGAFIYLLQKKVPGGLRLEVRFSSAVIEQEVRGAA